MDMNGPKNIFIQKEKKITLLNQQRSSSVYSKISDSSLNISSPFWISFCTDGVPHLSGWALTLPRINQIKIELR